ncbi:MULTISPECIES: hypothetical protein [unclassified Moorena]|nr:MULTISPECIES: hypothetical protein [unclassified Moorena]
MRYAHTADCITIRYTGLFWHFRLTCSLLPAPCSLKTQKFVPN